MRTSLKTIGTLVLVLSATLASGAAMAQHGGHGYGHGGGVRFGISVGVPLYGPGYFPAPYYAYPYAYPAYTYPAPVYAYPAPAYTYPSTVVVQSSSPPVYVEQSMARAAPAPSQTQADWYYCAASKSYYPYVNECPSGWQRVPAQPSR
jgi:hypothetical protein